MLDHVLCAHILEIAAPWHITKSKKDVAKQRIDIWVAPKGSWLKHGLGNRFSTHEAVWQHLAIGRFRTFVHVSLSDTQNQDNKLPWMGDTDMPFTHAMTHRVMQMMGERMSYGAVCSLLNVDLEDIWRLKHAINEGAPEKSQVASSPRSNNNPHSATIADASQDAGIPPIEDPVWDWVISNETAFDIRQLGLKLLISRVRNQYINSDSVQIKNLRKHELRKYFIKHERLLQHELQQLIQ